MENQSVHMENYLVQHFLDIDVTNQQELVSEIFILLITSGLLCFILKNIRAIFIWKQNNSNVDHYKLLKINLLLYLCISIKLFSMYYGIFGCILSQLWDISCDQVKNNPSDIVLYIEPGIYVIAQALYIYVMNFTLLLCSKYWLKVLQIKSSIETPSQSQSIKHKTAQYTLQALLIFQPLAMVGSIFLNQDYFDSSPGISRILIAFSTFSSALIFTIFCMIILSNLEDFYIVSESYTRKLKLMIFILGVLIFIRTIFNALQMIGTVGNALKNLKNGTKCLIDDKIESIIPDQGWQWAIFSIIFQLMTDIIPIYTIAKLFAPKLPNRTSLLQVEDNWEVESLE